MEPFLGKGHGLYTDNFYTSLALATHFLKNKTHLCGTIWSNPRNYSKEITSVKLQKLQAMFYKPANGSKMLACKYHANNDKASNKPKIVCMLLTSNQTSLVPMGKNDKDRNAFVKPALIREYNLHMGVVGHVDQHLHSELPSENIQMAQKISNQNYNANGLECPKDLCNHNWPENDFPSIHQKCSTKLGNNSGRLNSYLFDQSSFSKHAVTKPRCKRPVISEKVPSMLCER